MVQLTEAQAEPARRLSLRRFWVVALTAMAAPLVLLVEAVTGGVHDGPALAILGAALTLVALARVAATGDSQSRSLVYRARTDTMTGLANRAYLMRCLTDGDDPPWAALLLVDLDGFRQFNDAEGPSAGDLVLGTVADRLRHLTAADDVVARFGGDEFAILVANRYRDVGALAAAIVAATSTPLVVGGRPLQVTACVGVAVPDRTTAAEAGEDVDSRAEAEDLLRRAGLALRAAKEAGPGQWNRYDSERHGVLIERIRLRESLHRAVDEEAFHLFYQPIVEIATGRTRGFEALVRWIHPTMGLILPTEFIAVAEETGLIDAIGDLVLRSAVAAALDWPDSSVYVSVNVSPRQLRGPGFAERVDHVLRASGLPPARLMLELTESIVTKGSDHVWVELTALRDLGVRLAIDDFGTGFSSLSYLEQTPIGAIKMDKSFADSLATSDRQQKIVKGIVAMANNLGLRVVAEGIETVAERDILAEFGCPFGQGYLYSPPIPAADVSAWLTTVPDLPPPPTPPTEPPAPPTMD
jgi:diguanylate cyclase (GGDEF)-like protein